MFFQDKIKKSRKTAVLIENELQKLQTKLQNSSSELNEDNCAKDQSSTTHNIPQSLPDNFPSSLCPDILTHERKMDS